MACIKSWSVAYNLIKAIKDENNWNVAREQVNDVTRICNSLKLFSIVSLISEKNAGFFEYFISFSEGTAFHKSIEKSDTFEEIELPRNLINWVYDYIGFNNTLDILNIRRPGV